MIDYLGVAFLLAWTAGVWCFISVIYSKVSLVRKAIWGGVLLVPVIGVVGWLFVGPRAAK